MSELLERKRQERSEAAERYLAYLIRSESADVSAADSTELDRLMRVLGQSEDDLQADLEFALALKSVDDPNADLTALRDGVEQARLWLEAIRAETAAIAAERERVEVEAFRALGSAETLQRKAEKGAGRAAALRAAWSKLFSDNEADRNVLRSTLQSILLGT